MSHYMFSFCCACQLVLRLRLLVHVFWALPADAAITCPEVYQNLPATTSMAFVFSSFTTLVPAHLQLRISTMNFLLLPMLQSQPAEGTILVELNRTRGDPVLFLKPQDQGFARYGVPSFHDFDRFADTSSYEDRLNYHSIVLRHAR